MKTAVRWEKQELHESRERGTWDRWGVQEPALRGEWLFFRFGQHRIYAPLEHLELPHQFARLGARDDAILPFVSQYGRLGWHELSERDYRAWHKSDPWFKRAMSVHLDQVRQAAEVGAAAPDAMYSEPLDWLRAHGQTVGWCLEAGRVLRAAPRERNKLCESLAMCLPRPYGCRGTVRPDLGRVRNRDASDFVGLMLQDYLWINLAGVRRRVEYTRERGVRSLWGGDSLLESIYTMVADAVTGGRLASCEGCGAVFIQTDERQRFCPPREGQEKSTCMNRKRVQRYRKNRERKEATSGKATRTR